MAGSSFGLEYKGRWIEESKDICIAYLKAEKARGKHILIKPLPETEPFFLLADDLNYQLIRCHHKKTVAHGNHAE